MEMILEKSSEWVEPKFDEEEEEKAEVIEDENRVNEVEIIEEKNDQEDEDKTWLSEHNGKDEEVPTKTNTDGILDGIYEGIEIDVFRNFVKFKKNFNYSIFKYFI